jgi:hypothetical protein
VIRHGHTVGGKSSSEYNSWRKMKERCYNSNDISYPNYGGRGIRICDRWMSFASFLEDMGPKPAAGYEIDRPDIERDYEPGNARWIPKGQNCRHTSRDFLITYRERTQPLWAWCNELGLPYERIRQRITKYGWSLEEAFEIKEDLRGPSGLSKRLSRGR